MVVVGAAAALILRGTSGGEWVLLGFFVPLALVLLIGLLLLMTATYLLGTLTRHGSRLTESPGRRCAWTLLIWASGAALVGYGRTAVGQLGIDLDSHPEASHWLLGVGVALVAGIYSRSRRIRLGSTAMIAMLVAATAVLRASHG
ncbi:hypothetical protein [Micromonospora vulcania]|uniref:Uncharacterized protein n=1 Tax=Micromonospora vulcania TaxID=1441873 RepID=A0ABW1HER5_9ACTN